MGQFGRPSAARACTASSEVVLVGQGGSSGGSVDEDSAAPAAMAPSPAPCAPNTANSSAPEVQRAPSMMPHAFAVGTRVLVAGRTGVNYKATDGNDFTGMVTRLLPGDGYNTRTSLRLFRGQGAPHRLLADLLFHGS